MTSPSSPPTFRLETSDGGQEDGAQVDKGQLGGGAGPPPMESPFQGEDRNYSPQIKVNLNFRKGASASQPDPSRFDRDRLFSVVARGVPEELAGLPEYLRRTSKYLTDSEYTEGSTGKTCLMKAVLNLRGGANACIQPLLQIDRDSGNPRPLVNAQCTDEYYRGHSALHIAIEKRSLPCVRLLVENGADVHARACGRFFQKKSPETCFYFGELPLSLAACTKQWDVVTYLLENPHQPASLQAADSLGNTVLHALVMIADNSAENSALVTRMYDQLLQAGARLCPTVKLEDIPNLQGLTPLKLAAKEGKIEIFRHILQREFLGPSQFLSRKFTEWCYGPVRVSLYDLASVDSSEENSVLEIIAFHCRSPHRHRMVVLEPLNKLLQAKWNLLVPRFLFNFLCYLTYVSVFTAVTYHQPALGKDSLPLEVTAGNSMLLLGHILVLLGGAYILMGQLWYFWRRRLFIWTSFMDSYFEILLYVGRLAPPALPQAWERPRGRQHQPGPGAARRAVPGAVLPGRRVVPAPARVLAGAGLAEPAVLHARHAAHGHLQRHDPEGHPAGPASLPSGLPSLPFWLRSLVSLSQEAQDPGVPVGSNATEAAGKEDKEGSTAPYKGVLDASLELFKFTIGMGELAFQEQLRFRGVVLLLLLAYVLLTYVLLLNMLIALMSETVNSVATDSWSIWKLQKAISVLEMENGYWWCRRRKQQAGVRLTVGTRPDGSPDERWCFRVEEVNWAAWEQTLPTVCEEPSGAGGPGATKNLALNSQHSEDSAVEDDHMPLQPLESC
ncbi:transient receptor potential cation channel subfamily V member 2 isoform X1 [Camelus bactrianus]|uniref:Transient receptor potential cation channel subfamily V member 2 isoform X1 n=3 Tax=Camelus bactrianus TaxID=9837 RepID=A0AC58NKA9_CAMBA